MSRSSRGPEKPVPAPPRPLPCHGAAPAPLYNKGSLATAFWPWPSEFKCTTRFSPRHSGVSFLKISFPSVSHSSQESQMSICYSERKKGPRNPRDLRFRVKNGEPENREPLGERETTVRSKLERTAGTNFLSAGRG